MGRRFWRWEGVCRQRNAARGLHIVYYNETEWKARPRVIQRFGVLRENRLGMQLLVVWWRQAVAAAAARLGGVRTAALIDRAVGIPCRPSGLCAQADRASNRTHSLGGQCNPVSPLGRRAGCCWLRRAQHGRRTSVGAAARGPKTT